MLNIERKDSLSFKLLRWVVGAALLVGIVLSFMQIAYDAYLTEQQIESDGQRILAMFADPSKQALYSLDEEMAQQVIEGLLHHEGVRFASIGHPDEVLLAQASRDLQASQRRNFTDLSSLKNMLSRWLWAVTTTVSITVT